MSNEQEADLRNEPKEYCKDSEFRGVLASELDHIQKDEKDSSLVGLALSGGGIRSAAFGMGVMQALKKYEYFDKLDFLSTVSGGGYIGSALTWFRQMGFPGDDNRAKDFPFGEKGIGGVTTNRVANSVLDYVRQRSNYLTPGKGLSLISFVAVVLRGMFVSFSVYLALLTSAFFVLVKMGLFESFPTLANSSLSQYVPGWLASFPWGLNALLCGAMATLVATVVAAFVFSLSAHIKYPLLWLDRYNRIVAGQIMIGWFWLVTVGLVILGLLPKLSETLPPFVASVSAFVATGGGGALGFMMFRKQQEPNKKPSKFGSLIAYAASACLIYGVFLLAYLISTWAAADQKGWGWHPLWIGVGFTALFGLVVNINYSGLHRVYRDRLMETFLPNIKQVERNQWGLATDAQEANLETMCQKHPRPFHIINANIVLVDSETSRFKGRGGDSFTFSPLYCGSYATGWRSTSTYMKTGLKSGLSLATAMAISGAAVNPHTGVGGTGPTRARLVSALLSFMNLRLGYWAANPDPKIDRLGLTNYVYPGLRGLLGYGHQEKARTIELTDGGHFENLGLYELVRRRVNTIIVSDAGADPDYEFADLANAVERVRVDFGVDIRFGAPEKDESLLADIVPQKEWLKLQVAKRGYAVGRIEYPSSEKRGQLIYIKSTLIDNLPADVAGYAKANGSFPDQSTADQFFDETQFEAYRELGYQLTKCMFDDNNKHLPPRLSSSS